MNRLHRLSGTVVAVTGAAQGIGERIAETLGNEGAKLLLADIQEAKVTDVSARLCRLGTDAISTSLDITNPSMNRKMVDFGIDHFGKIDALVCCAGIDAQPGRAWEIDEDHWRMMIDVDLNGTWWSIQSVLNHMMRRRSGKIVVISSTSARTGSLSSSPAYSAAKAGLLGLVVSLSHQLEQFGILVNAITPGAIGSSGSPMTEQEKAEYLAEHPLGFGGTQPVADAVLYLLATSGNWLSGSILNVSGGRWRGI